MLHIERVSSPDRLEALREDWTALLAESAADGVFLTWEWLRTWWRHLRGDRELFLLLVWRGSELVGLAPFARRPGIAGLLPSLEFLGTGTVGSDYLDVIVKRGFESAVLESLCAELGAAGDRLVLAQLSESSGVASALSDGLRGAGWTTELARTDVCPHIRLAGLGWEGYLASIGSQHRQNLRRRLRQLEAEGALQLQAATTDQQRRAWLLELWRLHEARWRERGGSEALGGLPVAQFHEEFTWLALERGWLRLLALTVGGEVAALLYGFRYRDTFSYYQLGWDARFAEKSVGLVTLGLAIRSAIAENASEFDFLHGAESYKFLWARETRPLVRLEAFPPGVRGFAARQAQGANRACRRWARRALGERLHGRIRAAIAR